MLRESCLKALSAECLAETLHAYRELQPKLQELAKYYAGEALREDFDDDAAGKLPQGLKRGVLSEDALYDLLGDNAELQSETLEVIAEILRSGRF